MSTRETLAHALLTKAQTMLDDLEPMSLDRADEDRIVANALADEAIAAMHRDPEPWVIAAVRVLCEDSCEWPLLWGHHSRRCLAVPSDVRQKAGIE